MYDKISWAHGLGTDWDDDGDDTWVYSSVMGLVVTNKLGAFAEIYGFIVNKAGDNYSVDAGINYLLSNRIIADVMVGLGLNDPAPDSYISFGIAWKADLKK